MCPIRLHGKEGDTRHSLFTGFNVCDGKSRSSCREEENRSEWFEPHLSFAIELAHTDLGQQGKYLTMIWRRRRRQCQQVNDPFPSSWGGWRQQATGTLNYSSLFAGNSLSSFHCRRRPHFICSFIIVTRDTRPGLWVIHSWHMTRVVLLLLLLLLLCPCDNIRGDSGDYRGHLFAKLSSCCFCVKRHKKQKDTLKILRGRWNAVGVSDSPSRVASVCWTGCDNKISTSSGSCYCCCCCL